MAETFIRSHPGATPSFKGLYGFPGEHLHLDQPGDRARNPVEEARAQGRRHRLDRRRREVRGLPHRLGDDGRGRRGADESRRLLDVTRARARGRDRGGDCRTTTSATSARRCRRWSRQPGSASCAISSATASVSEFHEEPQVPNYGKPKRGIEARPGAHDRDRADGERRAGRARARCRTGGRS